MCLQQKNKNIATVVRMVKVVKDELKKCRDNGWKELLGVVTMFLETFFVPNMKDAIPGLATYHRRVDGRKHITIFFLEKYFLRNYFLFIHIKKYSIIFYITNY